MHLGIVVWTYRVRKRNNMRSNLSLAGKVTVEKEYHSEKRIDFDDISIYTEKPQKVVLTPRSSDSHVGWIPQVKTYPITDVAVPAPTASPKSKSTSHKLQLSVRTPSDDLDVARSPPPSYFAANCGMENQSPRLIPIPPSPAVSITQPPTPPTPPANRKTQMSFSSASEQPPMPAPTPRSESFAAQDLVLPKESPDMSFDESRAKDQKLPRLMSVVTTFTPSLEDELPIKIGDTVRMLEEYRDGWCLVQRVGRIDAPKGAVPRFCLQERRGVVPMMPTRKFSNGSLKSQGWR